MIATQRIETMSSFVAPTSTFLLQYSGTVDKLP